MDIEIINKYDIVLENRIIEFSKFDKINIKSFTSKYPGLDQFIEGWRDVEEINELLLPDISKALLTPQIEIKNGSELVSIVFLNNIVDFYPDYYNDFSISIFDFKEIVLGWKSFLSETP